MTSPFQLVYRGHVGEMRADQGARSELEIGMAFEPGSQMPASPLVQTLTKGADWVLVVGRGINVPARVRDGTVARNHVVIFWRGGELYAADLKSTNGTTVNGVQLEPEVPMRVAPGDQIALANGYLFELK